MGLASISLSNLALAQFPADEDIPPSIDPSTLADNSLFLRWRPSYHFQAPAGHMNDPCGPMYDPINDTYHLFYQAFPNHVNFGNTTWGHATSKDLITWTDVRGWQDRAAVAIAPEPYPAYDWLGDFSGSAYSTNLDGKQDGTLTMMFTGEQAAPDFWRSPYQPGVTEHQNIATSTDGGVTWTKFAGNPVIPQTPGNWNATGVRDPLFGPNPALDRALGRSEPQWYLTIGSGIRDIGPRIGMFTAPSDNLTDWAFAGALLEVSLNSTWGDVTKTGAFGGNFEMSAIYALTESAAHGGDNKTQHFIVNMGAEGYPSPGHPLPHWSLFGLGGVHARQNGTPVFDMHASGPLDWGNSYALNSFDDAKNDRRVLWGWSDEDLNGFALEAVGAQGALGLPREIFVLTTRDVVAPHGGPPARSPETWTAQQDGSGLYTVRTVAQRPVPEVLRALQTHERPLGDVVVPANGSVPLAKDFSSSTFHMRASVHLPFNSSVFGVRFRASPDGREHTDLSYHPATHEFTLDRSKSTLLPNISTDAYTGHIAPYTLGGGRREPLTLDLFVDGSLVEVFANDRFALTSRIYPSKADALGVALFDRGHEPVVFENVTVWDRFADVFPERPRNSSSKLDRDSYVQTHVTFESPYVPSVGYQIYDGT